MSDEKKAAELVKDDFVCIVGYGTANMLHEHGKVLRLTKMYVVALVTSSNLNRTGGSRRFRRDNGKSTPYGGYGGTEIHSTCQRPKKVSK